MYRIKNKIVKVVFRYVTGKCQLREETGRERRAVQRAQKTEAEGGVRIETAYRVF